MFPACAVTHTIAKSRTLGIFRFCVFRGHIYDYICADDAEQNNYSEFSVNQVNENFTHFDDYLGLKVERKDTDSEMANEDLTL